MTCMWLISFAVVSWATDKTTAKALNLASSKAADVSIYPPASGFPPPEVKDGTVRKQPRVIDIRKKRKTEETAPIAAGGKKTETPLTEEKPSEIPSLNRIRPLHSPADK